MVETDAVEGAEEDKASLDLDSEDGTQVIRRGTLFCSEETVIEVEPSDHCPNVECAPDGVELVVGSGDSGALVVGNRTVSVSSDQEQERKVIPFGAVVPSTTSPRSFEHL